MVFKPVVLYYQGPLNEYVFILSADKIENILCQGNLENVFSGFVFLLLLADLSSSQGRRIGYF